MQFTIGLKVLAYDGFSKRIGEIASVVDSDWGRKYVVQMQDGTTDYACLFIESDKVRQIGWYVATDHFMELWSI